MIRDESAILIWQILAAADVFLVARIAHDAYVECVPTAPTSQEKAARDTT